MMDIYKERKEIDKQLEECWAYLNSSSTLGDSESCIAFGCIMEQYGPVIGVGEALNLCSYVRKFTDPPRKGYKV